METRAASFTSMPARGSICVYSGRARKEHVGTWAPEPRVPTSMAVLARNAELTLPYRQVGANMC